MSRSIELSIEVPGTPEEVWDAIATAEGISSWFMPVESLSQVDDIVSVWEPPHRLGIDAPVVRDHVLAQEWIVESRGGGSCIVRFVQSGFGDGADWDDELDCMTGGWRIFLESLRLYLREFRGRHARCFVPMAPVPGPNARAWSSLCETLGISTSLAPGDRLSVVEGSGLHGTIESVTALDAVHCYLFLLDGGAGTGFVACEGAGEGGADVTVCLYLYLHGDDVEVAARGDWWTKWFEESFRTQASAVQ